LAVLFSEEKKAMIRRAAMTSWEGKHTPGPKVQLTDRKFPLESPHWNNNNLANRREMEDLRT
jgi:hypothetical protein